MSCELCKGHEVSHEKMRAVSPSLRHFMGASVSGGLGWVTSLFPTSPHTSLYRSRDYRTNVLSRLNLYFFSRDKQKRITTIRLLWCFSNCGPCNSLTLCTHEWTRQLRWPTWTRVIGSLCAVKLTSVFYDWLWGIWPVLKLSGIYYGSVMFFIFICFLLWHVLRLCAKTFWPRYKTSNVSENSGWRCSVISKSNSKKSL